MPFNGQDLIVKNRGLWELKLKNGCLSFPWFFGSVKWIFKNYQRRTYWKKNAFFGKILMCFQALWPYLLQRQMHCHCVWSTAPFFEDRKNNGSFETKVGSWVFGTTWVTWNFTLRRRGLLSELCSFWWSLVAWHETQVPDVGKQACFSRLMLYFTMFLVFRRGSQIDTSTVE